MKTWRVFFATQPHVDIFAEKMEVQYFGAVTVLVFSTDGETVAAFGHEKILGYQWLK